MISIILNCYDQERVQRHQTVACLAAIRKFTDELYEIIVVDNEPKFPIIDDYKVLAPYTHIINEKNKNVYESYNQGAKVAKGKYLVFVQNDVYCHERTINKLCKYLDKFDVAFPVQHELSREDALIVQNTPDGEESPIGWKDAGMLAITREAFDKTGGWPEKFHNLLGEKAFYSTIDELGLSWTPQTNALITHLKAANNLQKNDSLYAQEMTHDAELLETT